MSQLANARRQINSVRTLIRQQKYMPAIQAVYDAILVVLKNPLMKAEREEFEHLLYGATHLITSDPVIRKSAALQIQYAPGQERDLLENLRILLETFQEDFQQQAEQGLRLNLERRQEQLDRGQTLLDKEQFDAARGIFNELLDNYKEDAELRADIGERYLNAKQYDEAAKNLTDAIVLAPGAAHIYNSLAMAHRKLGQYAEAEQCYLKAAQGGYKDANLFFNLGRLYLDWQKFDKAIKSAKGALILDPELTEAKKLMLYAEKKLREGSE